jgi:prephenate dehydrogenase
VLIAVPVAATEATFKAIRHLVEPGVLFMDVGSTKRDVVDAARRVLKERVPCFVPAHPITGKEVAGIAHADAGLYSGRQVILTPLPSTNPELLQKAPDVWSAIGAQVLKMTPENHDAAFAAVSHLPHLLAFAYFSSVVNQPAGRDFLSLAGPGFRDFTRIAASSPEMWRDILVANREEVLKQSQRFRQALDALEHVIREGNVDALEGLIRGPAEGRANWQMGAHHAHRGFQERWPAATGTGGPSTHDVRHPFRPFDEWAAGMVRRPAPRASPTGVAAGRLGRGHDRRARPVDSDDTRVMR